MPNRLSSFKTKNKKSKVKSVLRGRAERKSSDTEQLFLMIYTLTLLSLSLSLSLDRSLSLSLSLSQRPIRHESADLHLRRTTLVLHYSFHKSLNTPRTVCVQMDFCNISPHLLTVCMTGLMSGLYIFINLKGNIHSLSWLDIAASST